MFIHRQSKKKPSLNFRLKILLIKQIFGNNIPFEKNDTHVQTELFPSTRRKMNYEI